MVIFRGIVEATLVLEIDGTISAFVAKLGQAPEARSLRCWDSGNIQGQISKALGAAAANQGPVRPWNSGERDQELAGPRATWPPLQG